MSIVWVLNASPVICLARAGYERSLTELPDQEIIPVAVVEEINAGPSNDPGRRALESGNYSIVSTQDAPNILAWDLGRGDTAVLSYANTNPDSMAIIDDLAARKCARSLQIPHKALWQ